MPLQSPTQMSSPSRLLARAHSQQQESQELLHHINQVQLELALLHQQVELARLEAQVLNKELQLCKLQDQQEWLEESEYHLRALAHQQDNNRPYRHNQQLNNCSKCNS